MAAIPWVNLSMPLHLASVPFHSESLYPNFCHIDLTDFASPHCQILSVSPYLQINKGVSFYRNWWWVRLVLSTELHNIK